MSYIDKYSFYNGYSALDLLAEEQKRKYQMQQLYSTLSRREGIFEQIYPDKKVNKKLLLL